MKKLPYWCLSALMIIAITSINFLLFASPSKYLFFALELTLIFSILFLLHNTPRVKYKIAFSSFNTQYIDFVILFFPLILFFLMVLKIYGTLTLIPAIVTSFFTLGYVTLRLINFHASESLIEWIVLSFCLSIPINCFLYTLSLELPIEWRAMTLSGMYLTFALLIIGKHKISKTKLVAQNKPVITFSSKNLLVLGVIVAFFFFSITATYPEMAYRPGFDIIRHYSESLRVNESSNGFSSSYLWFHFQLATLQLLSKPSMAAFQTALAFLSIVSILSFYIMAKVYLKDLNDKLHILATVFWSMFSGFGWLYFLMLKLISANSLDNFTLLNITIDKTYWDVGYGQGLWIWLWFRPLMLGVTFFFTLSYLLRRIDIDKKTFFVLIYPIVVSLGMLHFSELTFYIITLLAFSLFLIPTNLIRLKDSIKSSLLALLTILGLLFLYEILGIKIWIATFDIALLITVSTLSILILKLRYYISNPISRILKMNITYIYHLTLILSVLWLAMLFYWFTNTGDFYGSLFYSVYAVPWGFYPVLLGVCGLLVFSGIFHIIKHHRYHPVIIFIIIFTTGILFGRLLTYVNIHLLFGYWERRIIPLTFSASAIIASISVFHMIRKMRSKLFLSSILLSLIVVLGVTSTALSIEQQILATQKSMLTPNELNQIALLKELAPNSYLLTFSQRTLQVAEFVPFAWRIGYFKDHIWPATSPELVLRTLFSTGNAAVIYLSKEDYKQLLTSQYSKSYVIHHLLNITEPFYNDGTASIYNLQAVAPPAENSNVVLVMPENSPDANVVFAYDIMSSAGYNYTTAYISDVQTLSKAETIIVPCEILASMILKLKNNLQLDFKKLIVLNLDGYYGKLAEINYPSVNVVVTSTNYGDTSLREPIYQQYAVSTQIEDSGFTPFILETLASNNSLIIADDETSEFWSASASLEGNLSLPKLTDDLELKASGKDSLKIEVSNGNYAQWQISGEFSNITDLGGYDFISFYWYGKGNQVKYVVQLNTNTSDTYFWYEFTDSWNGWKKVILPMHVADGSYTVYGVSFVKVTKNKANWHTVKKIDFRLSGVNLNRGGIFHLDRFAFEKSVIVNIKVQINGNLQTFKLLNLNQNTYVSLAQINANGTMPIPEYYISNELPSKSILGEDVGNLTFTRYNNTYSEGLIEIRVPVASNESYPVQTTFAIAPTYKMTKASSVSGKWGSVTLPTEINLTSFKSSANLIAYYDDAAKTFFASKTSYDQVELIYLNFCPLINALKTGSRELYSAIGMIMRSTLGNLSSYTYKNEPINAGNTAAFREATMEGNITVSFESIIIQTEDNGTLLAVIDENTIYRLEDNAKLSPINFKNAFLRTTRMAILPGNGFYIKALVQNATLKLYGAPVNLVSFLNNNYTNSSRGNVITIEIENATVFLRKPLIDVHGQGAFKDLYAYQELNKRIRALGADCEITGHFIFTGIYGDTYSVSKNFDYEGSIKLPEPLYEYDEWQSFVEMLPHLLIVVISYLGFSAQRILRKED